MKQQDIMRMRQAARTDVGDGWFDQFYIANCLGSQHLLRYLPPGDGPWTGLQGVTITVKRARNRTGVSQDAVTRVYTVKGDGWTVQVRSVWRDGELLRPLKTHTRVSKVTPDNDDARRAYNQWLRDLDLI